MAAVFRSRDNDYGAWDKKWPVRPTLAFSASKREGGPRLKDGALPSHTWAPRGPPTCRNLWKLHRNHVIEVPG
jgi:hypothetical protein